MFPTALLALTLAADPFATGVHLPPGERWTYEIESHHDLRGRLRLELAAAPGRRPRSLVLRVAGGVRIEAEGRPQALLGSATSAYLGLRDEPNPVGEVLRVASHLAGLRGCGERWQGPPWTPGSSCRGTTVVGTCTAAGTGGVRLRYELDGHAGKRRQLDVCAARELALPLSVTIAGPDGPEIDARLAERGAAAEGRSLKPLVGVWARPDIVVGSRGVRVTSKGVFEVVFSGRAGAARYCEVGPSRSAWDGEHLAILRPLRSGGGVDLWTGEEYRLERRGERVRLVAAVGRGDSELYRIAAMSTGACKDRPPKEVRSPADELMAAVQRDDAEAVRGILDRGVPPDSKGTLQPGFTPLQVAISLGLAEVVGLLLDRGADPNAPAARERSSLLFAVKRGDPEMARLLVSRGARWEIGDEFHRNALAAAVRKPEVYAALLAMGAPPGYREVLEAVETKDAGALRAALTGTGWATDALFEARRLYWLDGMRVAVEAGAELKGSGVLLEMARAGHLEGVRLLLALGADPRAGTDAGALMAAILNSTSGETRVEIVRLLLAHGADPNWRSVSSVLTSRGEEPLVGNPPLWAASQQGSLPMVDLLLAAGADPAAPWRRGVPLSEVIARMRPWHPGTLVGLCRGGTQEATLLALVQPGEGVRALTAEVSAADFAAFERSGAAAPPALAALDAATRREGGIALRAGRRQPVGFIGAPEPRARPERRFVARPAAAGRVTVTVLVPAQCDGEEALAADDDLEVARATFTRQWLAFRTDLERRGAEAHDTPSFRGGGHGEWWTAGLGPSRFYVAGTTFLTQRAGGGHERRVGLVVLSQRGPITLESTEADVIEVPIP